MNVTLYSASNFRNISCAQLEPCPQINVIYGDNGHGKTNLLEGIGLFTGMRSFRGARNVQMITVGEKTARLELGFFAEKREQQAVLTVTPDARELTLNGVKKEAASEMIGRFCAVIFSPDRMSLITGGAAERRRFIDAAIGQIFPGYASLLYKFNQILLQRNTLLKEINAKPSLRQTIEIWDASLASYGAAVISRRARFLRMLAPSAIEAYDGISAGREQIGLEYEDTFSGLIPEVKLFAAEQESVLKPIADAYREKLGESLANDLKLGYTFYGPQRDDIVLLIGGKDARVYGSQGQKRSIVLALKLAEASILSETLGERPIALLDDVMSELDSARQDFLLNRLDGWQVFITCCDPGPLRLMGSGRIFQVENGTVEQTQ